MPSVMIVRDEVLKLRLEGRLSAAGISDVALTVVANAMEALDRTRVEPPTVLVVTSALTGTTPPEFCTAVRGILGAASTKLLLVTGADQALLAQPFLAAGGDLVLPVTVDSERLAIELSVLLGLRTRTQPRADVRILARLEALDAQGEVESASFASVVEMGVTTARVVLKGPAPEGCALRLSFVLPGTGVRACVAVAVRQVVDAAQHQYALTLKDVPPATAEMLQAFVERRTAR